MELWNLQPAVRGLAQPMTVSLLEAQVFAKPYFDPRNLLVAESEGRIVGMAHLLPKSPWPKESHHRHVGSIPLLLATSAADSTEIEDVLIQAAESRLIAEGARQIQLGGVNEPGPFYFGLASGSCHRGIPVTDERMTQLAERHGYAVATAWVVYELTLRGFRPPVDRGQMAARRSLNVLREDDPPFANFREACTFIDQHRTVYRLVQKLNGTELAHLTLVEMDAFSHLRGVRLAGIIDPQSLEPCNQDQAKFFLAEILRQLTEEGTAVVETQIADINAILKEVVEALGFNPTGQVRLYAKHLG